MEKKFFFEHCAPASRRKIFITSEKSAIVLPHFDPLGEFSVCFYVKTEFGKFCHRCARSLLEKSGANTHAGPTVLTCSPVDDRNTTNDPSPRTHGTCCWTLETWSQTTCQTTTKKVSFPLSDFQWPGVMRRAGVEDWWADGFPSFLAVVHWWSVSVPPQVPGRSS